MGAVGRLKDGASPERARAELDASFQTYMSEIGMKGNSHFNGIALIPAAKGSDGLRLRFGKPLLIVMTIVGLGAADWLCQRGEPAAGAGGRAPR